MADPATVAIGLSTIVRPDLVGWAEAWDDLVTAAPLPTPFSRTWWLEHVAQHRPRYVLVVEGNELIGGIALEERTVAGISFVTMLGAGDLCPDHLDLLARPGSEDAVAASVQTWLSSTTERVVKLGGLVERALVLSAFPPGSAAIEATAPFVRIGEPTPYLASRSKNFRSNIRKATRRADREGVRYRRLEPTEVSSGLSRLRELHVARWGDSRFLNSFDRFSSAALHGAAVGELSLHELVADRVPVASVVCFELGDRIFFYQAGRRPEPRWRSAGTLLLFKIIEDAGQRGLHEFDLLRGDETYKLSFADQERSLLVARSSQGLGGKGVAIATAAVRRARSMGARSAARIGERIAGVPG